MQSEKTKIRFSMVNVSIVLFKRNFEEIEKLVQSLRKVELIDKIYLIDNSPTQSADFNHLPAIYIYNNKNN